MNLVNHESLNSEWVTTNMDKIRTFKDLDVWRYGHALVLEVYNATKRFPNEERFGLSNQMQRSAVSITSNISEGFGRSSYKEKVQFYAIARGSLNELYNQLIISKGIKYLSEEKFINMEEQIQRTQNLLVGLIRKSKTFIN